MLQRIQTLYLLLALACMAVLFFIPFGEITNQAYETVKLGIKGCEYLKDGNAETFSVLPVTIILSLSTLLTLVSIVLFKKRMLQIRLSIFNIIIQLGSIGLMFFFLFQANKEFGEDWSTSIVIILPAVSMIFTYLAIRAIGKDEALVRSVSRLR